MVSGFPLVKNVARRIVFPILDADGDPVTGATGLDSEYSLDGASFANITDNAHEIATTSGVYYLDLLAAETNGDVVAIQVKTTSSGAKTTILVFYTAAQSMDTIDTNIDSIVAKLPTNYIMGSTVLTAKDDEIDAIKTMTDKIGTIANTGGTATIGAILGDFTNTALVARLDTIDDFVDTEVASILTAVDTEVGAIKTVTDKFGFDASNYVNAVVKAQDNIDFGVLQKASLNAATPSVTVSDKTGFSLSVAGIDAIIDDVIEGTLTLRQAIRLMTSMLASKSSGGGTATLIYRDYGDTKPRLTFTADADGNRTAVVADPT